MFGGGGIRAQLVCSAVHPQQRLFAPRGIELVRLVGSYHRLPRPDTDLEEVELVRLVLLRARPRLVGRLEGLKLLARHKHRAPLLLGGGLRSPPRHTHTHTRTRRESGQWRNGLVEDATLGLGGVGGLGAGSGTERGYGGNGLNSS